MREKHPLVASHRPPAGDLTCNPGMCPGWESNRRPFSSQAGTQPLSHTSWGASEMLSVVTERVPAVGNGVARQGYLTETVHYAVSPALQLTSEDKDGSVRPCTGNEHFMAGPEAGQRPICNHKIKWTQMKDHTPRINA